MNEMVVKKMINDVDEYVKRLDDEDEYRDERYNEHLKRNSCDRYLPVFGPNSKQWWVYDECEDVYIDPPKAVLDRIDNMTAQILTMGSGLDFCDIGHVLLAEDIIAAMEAGGEWLDEKEYWYKELEI